MQHHYFLYLYFCLESESEYGVVDIAAALLKIALGDEEKQEIVNYFFFLLALSIFILFPFIFISFIFSNTFLAFCLGTSTKVYLSYISIVPTSLPGIPASPAIAPNISLAWTLWFLPTFIIFGTPFILRKFKG